MNQIWTNPSVQRSLVLETGTTSNLLYCLKLTQTDSGSNTTKDTIIFPNMEYNFTFYDSSSGKLYSVTGLVIDVFDDQIKIKYIKNTNNSSSTSKCNHNCNNCKSSTNSNVSYNTNSSPMPICNCILNPPDISKYEGPNILFIPIANIVKVSYVVTHNPNNNNKDDGGIRVMLLGISATTIRAIIVRMAFFEDNIEEAVKYVDLKAGNIYDLTYESNDGAIYESRAKIMSIEEVDDGVPCKPGKGYVREHVGHHNSVYINCCKSKDEFIQDPPVKKIKIVVDTSESFSGRYETIMLDTIRDCVLLYDASKESCNDDMIEDYCSCCHYRSKNCHPDYCGHYMPAIVPDPGCKCNEPQTYVYTYENRCKAVVTGEKVSLTVKGNTTDIDLDTLLKYYLGIG